MQTKTKRFAPNIQNKGRLIRGLIAAVLFIGGIVATQIHIALCLALFGGGAFVLFEALRGWCAFRACGIKTKF
jgi:hypothetical protein